MTSKSTDNRVPRTKLILEPLFDELWNENQVAAFLGCSTKVLRNWRVCGSPFPFIKVGNRLVRYRRADVEAYIAANTRTSTASGGVS